MPLLHVWFLFLQIRYWSQMNVAKVFTFDNDKRMEKNFTRLDQDTHYFFEACCFCFGLRAFQLVNGTGLVISDFSRASACKACQPRTMGKENW